MPVFAVDEQIPAPVGMVESRRSPRWQYWDELLANWCKILSLKLSQSHTRHNYATPHSTCKGGGNIGNHIKRCYPCWRPWTYPQLLRGTLRLLLGRPAWPPVPFWVWRTHLRTMRRKTKTAQNGYHGPMVWRCLRSQQPWHSALVVVWQLWQAVLLASCHHMRMRCVGEAFFDGLEDSHLLVIHLRLGTPRAQPSHKAPKAFSCTCRFAKGGSLADFLHKLISTTM